MLTTILISLLGIVCNHFKSEILVMMSGLAANITVYENHIDNFSGSRYEIFSDENTENNNDHNNICCY